MQHRFDERLRDIGAGDAMAKCRRQGVLAIGVRRFVAAESEKWATAIRAANIKPG